MRASHGSKQAAARNVAARRTGDRIRARRLLEHGLPYAWDEREAGLPGRGHQDSIRRSLRRPPHGGLGKTGLAAAAAPTPANATAPTAAELRRLAIFNNYRAILDISPKGGYGVRYGPNIDSNGGNTLGEGKIAGVEYVAYADDGSGKQNVTLLVQVPVSFDKARPCIVTATSSGSRGVYGAIGSAGEWGLKRGCAVAYADKGTGSGVHDLATNTVNRQDGTRTDSATASAIHHGESDGGRSRDVQCSKP
jgi:hypothetical protein